jgi:hypothetical protein
VPGLHILTGRRCIRSKKLNDINNERPFIATRDGRWTVELRSRTRERIRLAPRGGSPP